MWGFPQLTKARNLVALLLALPMSSAFALTLSPVKLVLGEHQRTTSLQITNDDDSAKTFQVIPLKWSQSAQGVDQLNADEQLIASPALIEIQPHATQTIRIGLKQPMPSTVEQAWRIQLKEIPQSDIVGQTQKGVGAGVKFVWNASIPLFMGDASQKPALTAKLTSISSHTLSGVQLKNSGSKHIKIRDLSLVDDQGKTVAEIQRLIYLMPGSELSLHFDKNAELPVGQHGKLLMKTEENEQSETIPLTP